MSVVLKRRDLRKVLPHRGKALLIHGLEIIEKGEVIGIFRPPKYCFEGHFPGKPILPGHIIQEFVNLTLAAAAMQSNDGKVTILISNGGGKFRGEVKPGDLLKAHVFFTKTSRGAIGKSAVCYVGEKKVAEFYDIVGILVPN